MVGVRSGVKCMTSGPEEEGSVKRLTDEEVLTQLTQGVVTPRLTVCEQLGFETSAKDHGHMGGLLAGKIGQNRFVAQYAIDGRAKCRHIKCNRHIEANNLRIGKIPPSIKTGHSSRTHWYHDDCIFKSFHFVCRGTKVITQLSDIEGVDQLRKEDVEKLREMIFANNSDPARARPSSPESSIRNRKRKLSSTIKAIKPPLKMRPGEIDSVLGLIGLGGKREEEHPRPDDALTEPSPSAPS